MLSVIVPSYNTQKTLDACLQAIYDSSFSAFEVIVVDDGSSDNSIDIARQYPCRIVELASNQGLSHARNTGVRHSQYEYLVFIDADVVIRNNTLEIIAGYFDTHPDVSGVVGLLDEHCPYDNFFSQYKNLYMHHIFQSLTSRITFFYGSIHAIRKKDFQPYDESLPYTEDTELGQRLSSQGKTIVLLKELAVTHLKRHTLASILLNDFRIPFYWARLFLSYSNPSDMVEKKSFAHAKLKQVASVLLSPCILLSLFLLIYSLGWAVPVIGLMVPAYVLLNGRFFRFLSFKKGMGFAAAAFFFTLLDQTVMASGITAGAMQTLFTQQRHTR